MNWFDKEFPELRLEEVITFLLSRGYDFTQIKKMTLNEIFKLFESERSKG